MTRAHTPIAAWVELPWRRFVTSQQDRKHSANDAEPPQGYLAKVPYDLRRPTAAKAKSRLWNPDDPRFFTPKGFGAGWDINFYWLIHPLRYLRGRRSAD